MATPDVVRDMQSGLIKKATVVGIDGAETEARMVEAPGSHSVQLVELKLVSIAFSGTMGNLKWLAASAEHLAPTLKVLIHCQKVRSEGTHPFGSWRVFTSGRACSQ
jgi:hypothetical protein